MPSRDFTLTRLPVRAHVHFDGFGRQIVTLENASSRVTIIISGALATLGPVCLQIGWINLSDISSHVYSLNALANILMAQRYLGPPRRPATVDNRHLRNAIIAYDGECAGASRRQIAAVIYGENAIGNDWTDPSGRLKAMVKRDVLRGRRLVESGWRDLIAAGTFKKET